MNLTEYLKWRGNGNNVLALSRAEAKLLGIGYPLAKNWAHNSHEKLVPEDLLLKLKIVHAKGLLKPAARPGSGKGGVRAQWGRDADLASSVADYESHRRSPVEDDGGRQ